MSAKPWFNPQRDPGASTSNESARASNVPHPSVTPSSATPNPSAQRNAPAATAAAVPNGSQLTVGPNIRLSGAEIEQCDSIVIEGHVKATIRSASLRISSTGTFDGDAQVESAEIEGTYSGELNASVKLTVRGTGKITGTIRYGKLVVEEGGEVGGDVRPISEAGVKSASANKTNESTSKPSPGKEPARDGLLSPHVA